jgi:catechol 2,3-dioxygenase-like lactoylglutathione lyase family enzyme
MTPHLRIARPVRDLERSAEMYSRGLELHLLGRFFNHQGFDGVMLGRPGATYHFEFTFSSLHPVAPQPTVEDLVVLYFPDRAEWEAACARMLAANFAEVPPFNPYWNQRGRTYQDADGYRTVFECANWPPFSPNS